MGGGAMSAILARSLPSPVLSAVNRLRAIWVILTGSGSPTWPLTMSRWIHSPAAQQLTEKEGSQPSTLASRDAFEQRAGRDDA